MSSGAESDYRSASVRGSSSQPRHAGEREPEAGLERFRVHINPAVGKGIASWRDDRELSRLYARLRAITDPEQFFNAYAEAEVAHHLRQAGCDLRFEVPTPAGRTADFEVRRNGQRFFLHVKRVNTDRPTDRKLTVSSRLRYLERIRRPYVVSVRWNEGLSDEDMQRLVKSAANFITHSRVGDELTVHAEDGRELGGCRIMAPWEGSHVSLTIELPSGFDIAARMHKLLLKAYPQFMPRSLNVVLIASSHAEDVEDFETALLGSHIERWDAFPPRGRRVAHGRAPDGFWHGVRRPDSAAAGWCHLTPQSEAFQARLWFREGLEIRPEARMELERLLDTAGK